jgi:hypothetical protein
MMEKEINYRRDVRRKETHKLCVSTGWIVVSLLLLSFAVAAQQPLSGKGFVGIPSSSFVDTPSLLSPETPASGLPTVTVRPVLTVIGDDNNNSDLKDGGMENSNGWVEAPVGDVAYLMILGVIVYGIICRRKLPKQ